MTQPNTTDIEILPKTTWTADVQSMGELPNMEPDLHTLAGSKAALEEQAALLASILDSHRDGEDVVLRRSILLGVLAAMTTAAAAMDAAIQSADDGGARE